MPANEAEFQAYMIRLDRYLAEIEVPVVTRQMAAIAEACFDLGENRPVPKDRDPLDGVYTGDDFIIRVIRWYETTYGDTLKVKYWLPPSIIFLRGEHWRVRYPLVIGPGIFYAGNLANGPAVKTAALGYEVLPITASERRESGWPKFNVLDFVVDMPQNVRALINQGEYPSILTVICRNRLFLHALTYCRHHAFMEEALGDVAASVDHLLKRPPQTGASKWASLQATEKSLKSFLYHAGARYPQSGGKGHDLHHLSELVRNANGPDLHQEEIAKIQCSAEIRYNSSLVDHKEAARAHHASLGVSGICAFANLNRHQIASENSPIR